MAIKKKKKKEEFDVSLMGGFLPSLVLMPAVKIVANYRNYNPFSGYIYGAPAPVYPGRPPIRPGYTNPLSPERMPQRSRDPQTGEEIYGASEAWWEYTGVPGALAGGFGALGLQVGSQAPQAKWLSPFARFGFFTAWILEATAGTAAIATVLTILDPGHKWSGGLDEWNVAAAHPTTSKEILMGLGSWGTVV
jgi:hypothetical protein